MFQIIAQDLKTLARDRSNLFLMLLFPIILVFLLGNLLGNLDQSDEKIETMHVEYHIEAKEPQSVSAIDTFIKELEKNNSIKFIKSKDNQRSIEKVNNGDATAFVKFTKSLDIQIFEGLEEVQNRALSIIMNGFVEKNASIKTLAASDPAKLENLSNLDNTENVIEKDFGYDRTMLDYYAVAMIVMILFMGGGIGGAVEFYQGRQNGTLRRMVISPKSRASLYVQTVLGTTPRMLIQVVAIMVPSVLLFGANYAQSFWDNLLLFTMFITLGIAINAVFTLVGMLVKNDPTMIIMSILWVLMFLSGTFSKEVQIEGFIDYSPVWLAQNAAFQLTIFGETIQCLVFIAGSIGVTIAATICGALLFNKKEIIV